MRNTPSIAIDYPNTQTIKDLNYSITIMNDYGTCVYLRVSGNTLKTLQIKTIY